MTKQIKPIPTLTGKHADRFARKMLKMDKKMMSDREKLEKNHALAVAKLDCQETKSNRCISSKNNSTDSSPDSFIDEIIEELRKQFIDLNDFELVLVYNVIQKSREKTIDEVLKMIDDYTKYRSEWDKYYVKTVYIKQKLQEMKNGK